MRGVVIASAARTALGSFGGALKEIPAVELGGVVIREVLNRAKMRQDKVDMVIMGNALQAGEGGNPARQAAARADISQYTPGITVNVLCGSGMEAVIAATRAIRAGDGEIVVAGGMESMSQAPFVLPQTRWGARMGHMQILDTMLHDALLCSFDGSHMGVTAENVAEKFKIRREEQDAWAARSQQRAEAAITSGRFKDEIVPVEIPQKRGEPLMFDTDEFPRFGTTAEALARLKPVFQKDGTITAGNSSGINDGAAALLVMAEEKALKMGIRPLGRIVGYDCQGCEPSLMGTGPIYAVRNAIAKVSAELGKKIELVEINEAFAAQVLACLKELHLDPDIVNVNGGAIALGHPLGCSGARILVTLLYEMQKRDVEVGMASLCVGGGMGFAMIIERGWYC
ncbi:MAG: acetyl-CoA C-acetyltransferase [Deltaproteobacteria bacterium]|nr:acetyl-CoA C-acetyltransferase [Deltaproteobacteria bacterium]